MQEVKKIEMKLEFRLEMQSGHGVGIQADLLFKGGTRRLKLSLRLCVPVPPHL